MEKEFIPYDRYSRLKKLGFDEKCLSYPISSTDASGRTWTSVLVAPLFQQTFRWFRKEHQIFAEILTDCTTEPKFVYTYNKFYGNPKDLAEQEWGWENNIGQYSEIYRTYEEAELACLDELLGIVESKSE